jgi:hypothetical protein
MTPLEKLLAENLHRLAESIHATSTGKGWWADRDELMRQTGKAGTTHVKVCCLALAITELSEAIENVRAGETPDDKIPDFTGLEAEMADAIIRILDLGEAFQMKVPEAMFAKLEYNKGRTHRHGGKLA